MYSAEIKFVTFWNGHEEQIVVFPKIIQHSVMADNVQRSSFGSLRPIAGGFVVNGECVGESESLRMKARPETDTALLKKLAKTVTIEEEIKEIVNADVVNLESATATFSKPYVNKNAEKRKRRKTRGKR